MSTPCFNCDLDCMCKCHDGKVDNPIASGIEHAEALRHSVDGFLADPKEDYRPPGSGDFSLGSKVWPGTSKVIEEMGELQQVLGKLIAVAGNTKHWDGDLRRKLVEELGDLAAALGFFQTENLTLEETEQLFHRASKKLELFDKWHKNPTKP